MPQRKGVNLTKKGVNLKFSLISTPKFIMGALAQAKNGAEQFWK
jgi:hypothetical protein